MATHLQKHVSGIPVISPAAENENSMNWIVTIQNGSYRQSDHFNCQFVNTPDRFKQSNAVRAGLVTKRMSRLARTTDVLSSVREHGNFSSLSYLRATPHYTGPGGLLCLLDCFEHAMRLSPKLTEAVRKRLGLGAKILQVGGMEKVFKNLFGVSEKEILIKASQCYLSTTAGSLAGLLFISTEKVAFCSDKSVKLFCPTGDSIRIKYKVAIPLSKIESANQSENSKRPAQKYIQIVTVDNFEFWFMGFINHQKSFKCLQQAISQL